MKYSSSIPNLNGLFIEFMARQIPELFLMGQQDSTQVQGRRQEAQIQTKKTLDSHASEGLLNTLNFF